MADPIPWHPAFVQAMQLELEPFLPSLQFLSEVQLSSEPLRIDLLIIKKPSSLPITKNIARLFRDINIIEYKSPQDRISLHSFYKTLGYSFLYAALHKANINNMTLSIIGNRHPRKLFKELQGRVTERERGIYEVQGYPLLVQIVESRQLEAAENLWLRGLEGGLNVEVLGAILEESEKRDRDRLGAYLHAVLEANPKTVKEVTGMGKKKLTLTDVLVESGLTAEWEKWGETRGEKTGWERAVSLMKQGYTVEQLEQMDPLNAPPPVNP
ncbi:MAG: hypothetical protein LBI94_03255 [Treponema sp.]|nr:hypothetical protein [Treponema sp.]